MIRLNGDNFIGFDLGGFRSDFLSEIIRACKILYSALIYLTVNSRSIGFLPLRVRSYTAHSTENFAP